MRWFLPLDCIGRNHGFSFEWLGTAFCADFRASRHDIRTRRHMFQSLSIFFFIEEKIGDVKEGIAFEADVDKGGLHAGKHARHTTFVDGTCKRVFVFTLKIDFCELIFFDDRNFSLMRSRRDK